MKITKRKLKIIIPSLLVAWVVLGIPFAYYDWPVPESKYVKILGTRDKKIGNTDQRRIQTYIVRSDCSIDDSEPYVLANDDSILWLKWDSEDIQAQAKGWGIETLGTEAPYVKVNHYKWRVALLSWFPNTLSLTKLDGCPYGDGS